MDKSRFRFKSFEVSHSRSSMKIGVDAVLIGAWAGKAKEEPEWLFKGSKILDVGTGCGVISLILAQRFPDSKILGIDIDKNSIEESSENFANSPWSSRIESRLISFPDEILGKGEKFDLIVSNPPYFQSGVNNPSTPREKARHQASLSVFSLIENSRLLLSKHGRLSIIFPFEFKDEVKEFASKKLLFPKRICLVRDNDKRPYKRVLMELTEEDGKNPVYQEELTLFSRGVPTEEYIRLCHDYYLKF